MTIFEQIFKNSSYYIFKTFKSSSFHIQRPFTKQKCFVIKSLSKVKKVIKKVFKKVMKNTFFIAFAKKSLWKSWNKLKFALFDMYFRISFIFL